MEDIAKLVKELTDLAITARTYLNLRAVKEGLIAAPAPAAAIEEKPEKSARTKKEKPAPAAETPAPETKTAPKTVAAALGNEAPAMSEKESLDVAFKLAAAYLNKDGADKKETNKAALRAYIQKAYNASQVSGIPHPQRVEFIEWLKKETAPAAEPELVG